MAAPRVILGLCVGIVAVLLTTAVQLFQLDSGVVIILYVPSIMAASYIGGRVPALVTTAIAMVVSARLCEPVGHFGVLDVRDLERLGALLAVGVIASVTIDGMSRARMAAEKSFAVARRGEERLSKMFLASPVAKSLSRLTDRKVVAVNDAYLTTFGVAYDEIVGHEPVDAGIAVGPESREQMFGQLRSGGDLRDVEVQLVSRTGEIRWVLVSSHVIEIDGEALAVSTFVDLTARKRAEADARAADERLRELATIVDAALWVRDAATGSMLYVSPGYEKLFGRTTESLLAEPHSWAHAVHPDDRARVVERAATDELAEDFRVVRAGGEVRWIRARTFPVRDASGRVIRVAGVAEDITADLVVRDKLHQAQKLESIGLLAGGVAHDFNNILCVITANLEMLAEVIPPESPDRELVGEIGLAAERACSLTRQLLAFGRQQVVAPVLLDLNETVDETRRMLRRMLGEDVTLRVALDPDLCRVRVDPGQIAQVLVNLCVNARDAMPPGGMITVETRAERGHALITVTDDGPGIPDDIKARVFEPFFTTKPVGKGTGLGLAVVHGIVEQAGGSIELDSRVGVGTTFRIRLPAAADGERGDLLEAVETTRGSGRILLVDDDLHLRTAVTRTLKSRGYEVLEAVDGRDALRVLRRENVDLLITDVVMPEMNGRELVEAAAREYPHIRVLYTSGYTDDEIVRRGIRQAEVEFLEKPFAAGALAAKVKAVLEA